MPNSAPRTKPTKVADSVTQRVIDEAARRIPAAAEHVLTNVVHDLMRRRQQRPLGAHGAGNHVAQRYMVISCALEERRAPAPRSSDGARHTRSRRSMTSTTTTGARWRSTSWTPRRARRARARYSTQALLVIGMAGTQAGAHPLRDLEEFRRLADLERAVARKIASR